MRYLILLSFVCLSFCSNGAKLSPQAFEDSLSIAFDELRQQESKEGMIASSKAIMDFLKDNCWRKEIFAHRFSKISSLSTMKSPDEAFRFFNWNIELPDFSQKYYCLLVKNSNRRKLLMHEFKDTDEHILNFETQTLEPVIKWYGALYYGIIPVEKNNKTYYTLLSWDGNNNRSSKKIIDILYFSGKKVKLGMGLFKFKKEVKKRYVMEFSAEAVVSLQHKQVKKTNYLIFNDLVPQSPNLEGLYEFYYPDLVFNGFQFSEGYWVFEQGIDVRLSKEDNSFFKGKEYNPPK